ncbi:hypothetical protein QUF74_16710 [Candidatus Halobeggiatoa sp. HSG11]|nr:hypothetical protein [Candidatus Halobeggiatoa sp. HSG11]
MLKQIFKADKKYTFSDYFEMRYPTEEIVAELGYSLITKNISLPRSKDLDKEIIENLRSAYYAIIPKISVNSEASKREVMIAPILQSVIRTIDAKLNIEYAIEIDEKLGGMIDYFFRSKQDIIVIEAKKGDLDKGFNQLAAEMIAVDKYEENDSMDTIYGAISIGEVWRFALLERQNKCLIKDIHTFRFPEDLMDIFAILKGILTL